MFETVVKGQTCLQVVVQPVLSELILQVDSEVHVFHRVDHDVDELHTGHLVDRQSHVYMQRCKESTSAVMTVRSESTEGAWEPTEQHTE